MYCALVLNAARMDACPFDAFWLASGGVVVGVAAAADGPNKSASSSTGRPDPTAPAAAEAAAASAASSKSMSERPVVPGPSSDGMGFDAAAKSPRL